MSIKLSVNQSFNNSIIWIALILIAWSPHIALDYVYTEPTSETYSLNNGQYYFFIATILAGVILFLKGDKHRLILLFRNKALTISLALFFLGSMLSNATLWNWRLLIIVLIISSCAIFAANIIYDFNNKNQKLAVILLSIPFAFPVLASLILHFFGPVNIGIVVENSLHMNYDPNRWFFLNSSANGFGFDASIFTFSAYAFLRFEKNILLKLISFSFLAVGCYCLLKSGTRAAFILFGSTLFFHEIFTRNYKQFLILFSALCLGVLIFVLNYELGGLLKYLRIEDTLAETSSSRSIGIVEMWKLFLKSPFFGMGFGVADNNFPVYPSNIFYIAILVELGVIGALGCFAIAILPTLLIFIHHVNSVQQLPRLKYPPLIVWAISLLSGFLLYGMFEFCIFRVSMANQYFFFVWSISMFYFFSEKVKKN